MSKNRRISFALLIVVIGVVSGLLYLRRSYSPREHINGRMIYNKQTVEWGYYHIPLKNSLLNRNMYYSKKAFLKVNGIDKLKQCIESSSALDMSSINEVKYVIPIPEGLLVILEESTFFQKPSHILVLSPKLKTLRTIATLKFPEEYRIDQEHLVIIGFSDINETTYREVKVPLQLFHGE